MSRFALSLIALAIVGGCSGRDAASPTSPDGSASARAVRPAIGASLLESFPRRGELHVTKVCSSYTRLAGGFCTITGSNIKEIEVGSKVIYETASGATVLDTDVTLDPPGPGNNVAFGHRRLDLVTAVGLCTFSGGTGKFTWFNASAGVSHLSGRTWAWTGAYSFSPHE